MQTSQKVILVFVKQRLHDTINLLILTYLRTNATRPKSLFHAGKFGHLIFFAVLYTRF